MGGEGGSGKGEDRRGSACQDTGKGGQVQLLFQKGFQGQEEGERPSLVLVAQVKKGGFRLEFWVEET